MGITPDMLGNIMQQMPQQQPLDWTTANRNYTPWGAPMQNQMPQQQFNPNNILQGLMMLGQGQQGGGMQGGYDPRWGIVSSQVPGIPPPGDFRNLGQPTPSAPPLSQSIPGAGALTNEMLGRPKPGSLADWKMRNGY